MLKVPNLQIGIMRIQSILTLSKINFIDHFNFMSVILCLHEFKKIKCLLNKC